MLKKSSNTLKSGQTRICFPLQCCHWEQQTGDLRNCTKRRTTKNGFQGHNTYFSQFNRLKIGVAQQLQNQDALKAGFISSNPKCENTRHKYVGAVPNCKVKDAALQISNKELWNAKCSLLHNIEICFMYVKVIQAVAQSFYSSIHYKNTVLRFAFCKTCLHILAYSLAVIMLWAATLCLFEDDC